MMNAKEREESKKKIAKLLAEAQNLAESSGFELPEMKIEDRLAEKLQGRMQLELLHATGAISRAVNIAKELGHDAIAFLGGKIVWSHEGNESVNGPLLVDDNWSHSDCYLDSDKYKWIYGHERNDRDY